MRKTDKKTENALRARLNDVCESLLEQEVGFCWLTHTVDYQRFPQSLKITCVFKDDATQASFQDSAQHTALKQHLTVQLQRLNIVLKDLEKHLFMDNEAACERSHDGNWSARLRTH